MTSCALNKFLSRVPRFSIISVRCYRESRWLGYHRRKIPVPIYHARKKQYYDVIMKPMEEAPSLVKVFEERNKPHPVYGEVVDIGLPKSAYERKVGVKERLKHHHKIKTDVELEKKALAKELIVNLDEVREDWQKHEGPLHIKAIAEHYGIYKDLYQHAAFTPWVPLNIFYDFDDESVAPIFTGNVLESIEVDKAPQVSFSSKPDELWTLVLTNLDGHLLDNKFEYLHWLVGNIKGGDLGSGETICDYLRPFPMRGTGYHRLVFVLYKQDKIIDFSKMQKKAPCVSLKERTFKTFDFYEEHQDFLTPASLAFFQCTWDPSLTNFFHNVLNMREPSYEYPFDGLVYSSQVVVPHKQPFNLYLDRFRDPKEIKKEVLLKRLKMIHPFKEDDPMPKYPCLHKPDKLPPSWLKDDYDLERMRLGKFRDLRTHSVYPQEDNWALSDSDV